MRIFVIGGGAREHAIIWKLKQSPEVKKIYCAPGNAGICQIAECVDIKDSDIDALRNFASEKQIDLTVVGPEVPLVKGIVDAFAVKNLQVFGPNKKAAQLEGSKAFAKNFMEKYEIPTARYGVFSRIQDAMHALGNFSLPYVIKADGLAAGKGVIICHDKQTAEQSLQEMMISKKFGQAGKQIVIEEFLDGIEASLLCFVDGNNIIPMESARDYKKAYNGDKGLNTGGMGCFSPNTIFTPKVEAYIKEHILDKTIKGFHTESIDFHGVLFIGLMIKNDEVKVLEYNVRFGDPEAEVVLPRLESDLLKIMQKSLSGNLKPDNLKWSQKKSITVFAASGGYPKKYEKGKQITGFENLDDDILLFHAGTRLENNKVLTNGGRVIAVTALNESLDLARKKVYDNIQQLNFEGMFYRNDIGLLEE